MERDAEKPRVIKKGEITKDQDYSKEDWSDGYILDSEFTDCKFGNLRNLTAVNTKFIRPDFTNSDLTGFTTQDCTLEEAKMVASLTAWQRQIRDKVVTATGLFPAFAHEPLAYLFEQEAAKIKDEGLQKRALEAAEDVKARKDLCYEELGALWHAKWYPDIDFFRFLMGVFKTDPRLWKVFSTRFKAYADSQYPDLKEEEWQGLL